MIRAFLICAKCGKNYNSIKAAGNHQTATKNDHNRFEVRWTE